MCDVQHTFICQDTKNTSCINLYKFVVSIERESVVYGQRELLMILNMSKISISHLIPRYQKKIFRFNSMPYYDDTSVA